MLTFKMSGISKGRIGKYVSRRGDPAPYIYTCMEDHMDRIYGCCAGGDVHKKLLVVCLRKGKRKEIKECGTDTCELRDMAEWLLESGCECFAMESTGSYWQPVYNVLEDAGLNLVVVNPRHMKNIPGKKTDQADADWICDLLRHGLLKPSYIPDRGRREKREAEQRLQSLKQMRASEVNRLQKTFEGCNVKISGTINDITGMSGRALLGEYLEKGTLTIERVQEMRAEGKIASNLKASDEQIVKDFQGSVSTLKRNLLLDILESIDSLDKRIASIRQAIEDELTVSESEAAKAITILPGIGDESARIIIDVLGPTLEQFETPAKLASWAGVAPGNNRSAGKNHSGRTTHGNKLLKTTLVQCANSGVRKKDSFFHAKYERLKIRMGHKKAIMAIAHTILCSIWRLLRQGIVYEDLGVDYYNKHGRERKINRTLKTLQRLGVDPELLIPIQKKILSA